MQDQFNEYVRSKGKEPDDITEEEKEDLKAKMTGDLFPGKYFILSCYCLNQIMLTSFCVDFYFILLLLPCDKYRIL